MEKTVLVVQTTLPGEWIEAEVGDWVFSIISERLATCAQRNKVESTYRGDDGVEFSSEWRIQFKAPSRNRDDLISKILKIHPYNIPQLLAWDADTSPEYLNWVQA